MDILKKMIEKAKTAKRTIVLPEGQDPRVIKAAVLAVEHGVCTPVVLGTPEEISAAEKVAGMTLASKNILAIDYTTSDLLPKFAAAFYEKRKAKGMTEEEALATMKTKRLYFGNMYVAFDYAQGLVAGSIASTGDMLRSAFHCVGTKKGIKLASSAFIMDLQTPTEAGDGTLMFADCAVNPCPTAEELVDIALATAESYRQLVGGTPRIAFLSYSTKGSAKGELVDKMHNAAALAKAKAAELGLDAVIDGEMQLDAALVASVGKQKNPNGEIQGNANVLIFPDLQAGNIGYKLVQRLGGAAALGPALQGLAKPVNDLSRGCSAEDIFGQLCITVLQSM